jgi:N-acetylglucosamine kinase-like BadF-type ATPase
MYFIAIDGGGTKTDMVLFDETGLIVRRLKNKGCNPTDIGLDTMFSMLYEMIGVLEACISEPVASIFGGISGHIAYKEIIPPAVKKHYPKAVVHTACDGIQLISGTLGSADGCGLVCGTGSSLFIRKSGEPITTIGGRGYIIDTGGSGYCLGRDAFYMAFKSMDKRIKPTLLVDILGQKTGLLFDDWQAAIYKGGRSYIASFADAVFVGLKEGDWACKEIVDHQASLLAELTYPAETHFTGGFDVVMSGGIVTSYPEYVQAIKEKASKRANLILAKVPPIYGAAVEALYNLKMEPTEQFKINFLESLGAADKNL